MREIPPGSIRKCESSVRNLDDTQKKYLEISKAIDNIFEPMIQGCTTLSSDGLGKSIDTIIRSANEDLIDIEDTVENIRGRARQGVPGASGKVERLIKILFTDKEDLPLYINDPGDLEKTIVTARLRNTNNWDIKNRLNIKLSIESKETLVNDLVQVSDVLKELFKFSSEFSNDSEFGAKVRKYLEDNKKVGFFKFINND